jgi:hypothetical protein
MHKGCTGMGRGRGWGGAQQNPEPLSDEEADRPGSPGGCRTGGSPGRPRSPSTARRSSSSARCPRLGEEFADAAALAAAHAGRISRFREQTREERIEIARQAEHRFGRKVAWGARLGESTELFTTLSVPVMTRLRQPERIVLDTLVAAGVARSRSEALAWAVRLVGEHAEGWLGSCARR